MVFDIQNHFLLGHIYNRFSLNWAVQIVKLVVFFKFRLIERSVSRHQFQCFLYAILHDWVFPFTSKTLAGFVSLNLIASSANYKTHFWKFVWKLIRCVDFSLFLGFAVLEYSRGKKRPRSTNGTPLSLRWKLSRRQLLLIEN